MGTSGIRLLVICPLLFAGCIATFITGYLEAGIYNYFLDDPSVAILLVIAVEITKAVSVFIYAYGQKNVGIHFPPSIETTILVARLFSIIFSLISCCAAIAVQLNRPNYDSEVAQVKSGLNVEYSGIYQAEDQRMTDRIDRAYRTLEQAQKRIYFHSDSVRYANALNLYNAELKNREVRLAAIIRAKDSISDSRAVALQHDVKSQSKAVQGIYSALHQNSDVEGFASAFKLISGILITLALELMMWVAFAIIGSVTGDLVLIKEA